MTTRVVHIRQRRLALGITQQTVANRAHVAAAIVRDLENGRPVSRADRQVILDVIGSMEKAVLMRAAEIMRARDDR